MSCVEQQKELQLSIYKPLRVRDPENRIIETQRDGDLPEINEAGQGQSLD